METQMQLQSAQRTLRQSILIETREAMDGTLQSFSETLTSGAISSKTNGSVRLREFRLETIADQQNSRKQIEWPEGSWGPLGIHQMLLRTPMRPKEARQAKVFLPQMHQLADVTLVAGEPETTTSPDGLLADVVPIDVVMQLAKEGIRVRMWIDSQGRVQKTIWPEGLNLSSFRITPQMAVKLQSEDELRTYQGTTLAWDPSTLGQDLDIDNAAQVQYTITSEQADPHKLFVTGANQQVKAKPVYEVTLTVHKPDWTNSPPTIKQLPPSLKELSSTEWLPADHAAIQQLADQWSGQTQEPVEIAQNLLQALHQHCHHLDVVSTIHPAPIVAQSLEGNCVELSMVLASLLRNKQIPARLASGLRMVDRDGQSVWAYQMWTEAWLKGHWIPLDPTTGQLTSCAYLKFIDTSLDDSQPYQPVLDVMRALKPLKISQVTIPK